MMFPELATLLRGQVPGGEGLSSCSPSLPCPKVDVSDPVIQPRLQSPFHPPIVREFAESLEARFTELLGWLRFDEEVLEWVRDPLHTSHADKRRENEEAIRRH